MVLLACGSSGGSTAAGAHSAAPSPTPIASPQYSLSAADRAQVAQLEKKPLKIPAPAADSACHQGPFTPEISP